VQREQQVLRDHPEAADDPEANLVERAAEKRSRHNARCKMQNAKCKQHQRSRNECLHSAF
jgi:hypothetical protein